MQVRENEEGEPSNHNSGPCEREREGKKFGGRVLDSSTVEQFW